MRSVVRQKNAVSLRAVDLQSMRTTDDFIARSLQRAGDTIHSRHAMPAN